MAITKPPVLPAWAETAANPADIVQPTNLQIQAGWPSTTTPPSRQRFNWILNFCANAVRYFCRRGLPDYDAAETYLTGDLVRGDNGLLYRSLIDSNTAHTPSSSPTQWGSPTTVTPAQDDNSSKVATTSWTLGQISSSVPVMDGAGAIGVSLRFARADHVHPHDSSKADINGSYAGMSVGFASAAGVVSFSGITGKPTTCTGYGITDAITTTNIGSQSVSFANSAGRAYPYRWDGAAISIIYSGQGGQPNWLLGSNDGLNFYVWNPANFSVNFATSAGSATNATNAVTQPAGTANTTIATTAFANPGASLAANGWAKLPSGLIMQWGTVNYNGGGSHSPFGSISFPIAFPNGAFSITGNANTTAVGAALNNGGDLPIVGFDAITASSFRWRLDTNDGIGFSTGSFKWIAIGH